MANAGWRGMVVAVIAMRVMMRAAHVIPSSRKRCTTAAVQQQSTT
jgi:hypothetical protein